MARTVGIEIEVVASSDFVYTGTSLMNVLGSNTSFLPESWRSTRFNLREWRVSTDASLAPVQGGTYEYGAEVISPPIEWNDAGRQEITEKLEELNSQPVTVNRSCGIHVHVDVSDLTFAQFRTVVDLYLQNQALVDTVTPPSRKSTSCSNRFLGPVNQAKSQLDRMQDFRQLGSIDRYAFVNPTSYLKYKTIEFRQHSGTTSAEKILNWVEFVVSIVELAKVKTVTTERSTTLVKGRRSRRKVNPSHSLHHTGAGLINSMIDELSRGDEFEVAEFNAILNEATWRGRNRHASYWLEKGWVQFKPHPDAEAGDQSTLLEALSDSLRLKMYHRAVALLGSRTTPESVRQLASTWNVESEVFENVEV